MDPQSANNIQDFQQPPLQKAPKKKTNKLLAPLIFTSLLAVVGIGFGIYKQFFEEQKSCENTDVEAQSNTDADVSEKIDTAIVENILQSKYDVQKYSYMGLFNQFYSSLDDFGDSAKALLAIDNWDYYLDYDYINTQCDYSQDYAFYTCSISYNDFNAIYKKLFGEDAKKESFTFYNSAIQKITYDNNANSYQMTFGYGLGGVDFRGLIYKVVEAEKNNKQISATVVVEVLDSIPSDNVDYESSLDEYLFNEDGFSELYNTIKAYEFVFTDYDGDYCLTSINKL